MMTSWGTIRGFLTGIPRKSEILLYNWSSITRWWFRDGYTRLCSKTCFSNLKRAFGSFRAKGWPRWRVRSCFWVLGSVVTQILLSEW